VVSIELLILRIIAQEWVKAIRKVSERRPGSFGGRALSGGILASFEHFFRFLQIGLCLQSTQSEKLGIDTRKSLLIFNVRHAKSY
jgi:hypothetical protein